ncbi:MAG: tetratricopeptide repeat protein [Rhodospirillales bacterium]
MWKLLPVLLIAWTAAADDRWIQIRSGPFHLISNAGEGPARDTLNQLEQIRHVTGTVLGKPELTTVWPIRVLLIKPGRPSTPALSRDAYISALTANAPIPREWLRECIRILIDSNARRMPAEIEAGLADFYSTATVKDTVIRLGAPLPPDQRNPGWARIHLLTVDPEYYGKLRVLLHNLQQGADPDPAYRNAFGKTPGAIDKEAAAYLAAGKFSTITLSGRPLNPRRDFFPEKMEPAAAQVALADLTPTRANWEALLAQAPAEAHEGLGFLALRENRPEEARKEFAAATAAGSKSARAWLELARLDREQALPALSKAAELNPAWAEPHVLLAEIETDPSRKLHHLKLAADLAPRSSERWRALAEFNMAHDRYPEAAKAWSAAQAAAVDDAERARMRDARLNIERQRLDYEAAERRRREEEKQREIQRVKDEAMARIRAAEERANRGAPPPPPDRQVVPWWEGPAPDAHVTGRLTQIDCVGRLLRLVIQSGEGKSVRLLIRDPAKVVVMNPASEAAFACGAQRPVHTVKVEYYAKSDAKLATIGEVATVEYLSTR